MHDAALLPCSQGRRCSLPVWATARSGPAPTTRCFLAACVRCVPLGTAFVTTVREKAMNASSAPAAVQSDCLDADDKVACRHTFLYIPPRAALGWTKWVTRTCACLLADTDGAHRFPQARAAAQKVSHAPFSHSSLWLSRLTLSSSLLPQLRRERVPQPARHQRHLVQSLRSLLRSLSQVLLPLVAPVALWR